MMDEAEGEGDILSLGMIANGFTDFTSSHGITHIAQSKGMTAG